MTDAGGHRRWSFAVVVPILIVVACVAVAVFLLLPGDTAEPVDVTAEGPRYDQLDQLLAASDAIVIGTVTAVDAGRVLTDPSDSDAGIRTQLAAVEIDEQIGGGVTDPLIVEQEAELLDGTPVRVNGVVPLAIGDRGLMLLIRGDSDEFPYTAFVNEQGWVPIVGERLAPIDPGDAVWADLVDAPVEDVIVQLTARAG